jgi:hypothetical protein
MLIDNLMKKIFSLLGILMPFACFAQVVITGRVLNQADTKPLANVSVFLNNTTLGDKTTSAGTFTIRNVKPGKYELVVSIIGYDTYQQPVVVGYNNLKLPDIAIFPKAIGLKEVTIKSHSNPHRAADLEMFKREFLGTSVRARQCTILNPEVLNVEYNDTARTLTASSDDFLEIENDALGYIIKYKLTKFLVQSEDTNRENVFFDGSVFFSEMKGTPSRQNRWELNRQDAYDNSTMHFLRAALADKLDTEGFRVQQYALYANPARPADSLITSKIKFYESLKSPSRKEKDSLSLWNERLKLSPVLGKLMSPPLFKHDIIETTSRPGVYLLNCDNDCLYVDYNKNRKYRTSYNINHVYDEYNEEYTLIKFNGSKTFFDGNGIIFDLNLSFVGAWTKNRFAEFLPYDYTPLQSSLQADDDEHVVAGLQKYIADHPVEKAYLQFDKPYYAAGDTIYFKAYVAAGELHKLSGLSGILHVDLINTKNKIDQSIKLQLDSGLAHGDFALPDSLPAGSYRIRAYTQLMSNFGETAFFDKPLSIGSAKTLRIHESPAKQPAARPYKPDLQFFPEGGSMVAGVRSKVAFKAIDVNGLGVDVKGSILDNDNKEITQFESVRLGMGAFYVTPAPGKNYRAKISYPDGGQDLIDLPNPAAAGITLSINNDSIPTASVRIAADADYYKQNQGKTYTLVIYAPGSAITVNCKLDSPVITLDILKRKLHTGVAVVTLFSPAKQPLSERLLFIQNYDQLNLSLSGKDSYAKREHVNIKLNALNRRGEPASGNFSVAVTDENKAGAGAEKADNILTNLLLTSDLKGYVEQPDYYFADTSAVARQNLDLLMLTQGYRRFEWKQVLDSAAESKPAYQPENGLSIAGQVKNIFNKPAAGATINLFQPVGGLFLSTKTDDKGMFRFTNMVFTDTAHLVLSAVKANGKNSTKISVLDDNAERPVVHAYKWQGAQLFNDSTMAGYVANDMATQKAALAYLNGKGVLLKQVNIHSKKPDNQYRTQSLAGAGNADQVVHADKLDRIGGQLTTKLAGLFHGPMGFKITEGIMPGLIVVDGVEEGPKFDINSIAGNDVETVELLEYASASMYGMAGGHGVLVITTKEGAGLSVKDINAIGVLPIDVMGYYKAREFYAPKYEPPMAAGKQADLRSTVYWNPEIKTDNDGNASFDYYNADGTGTYKVTIEGIDKDGNIGRQVYRYTVE